MATRKLIGKVSATEKYPSSCDEFQFWLSDDAILSPFDIVRVENKLDGSVTYGVVQDILHITDGTGHISNYVSSDFGNVDTIPMTRRLSLSYAKVSVVHNTKENYMFRSHFEESGATAEWQTLYRNLTGDQKERLMKLVSLNVSDLKNTAWPDDLRDILEYYLIKWSGKTEQTEEKYVQMSLMDDSDIVVED